MRVCQNDMFVPMAFIWLSGLGVWFSLWVREVPGSNPGWALIFCSPGKNITFRGHTDLNHGPIGLQPIALPLSYIPYSYGLDSLWILLWCSNYQKSLTMVYVQQFAPQNDFGKGQNMPWPGFEPGLLRPQRRVLTTRRSRQLTLGCPHRAFDWQKSAPPQRPRNWLTVSAWPAANC